MGFNDHFVSQHGILRRPPSSLDALREMSATIQSNLHDCFPLGIQTLELFVGYQPHLGSNQRIC